METWRCWPWLLLAFSAVLGALPFIYTKVCAECVFIFLVPLFYLAFKGNALSFREGFFWGIIFYSIYFYGLFVLIMQHGNGSYRFLAGFALIMYGAFWAGVWFFISNKATHHLADFFQKTLVTAKLTCWISVTWLYFWLVDTAFFSVFGLWEGDQLRFLLLPLAVRPQWLYGIIHITRLGGLLLIIVFSAISSCWLAGYKKKASSVILIVSFLPFAAGWFYNNSPIKEFSNLETIICLIPTVKQNDPWIVHEHICELLTLCSKIHGITTILLPESAFQFPLNDWERTIDSWYKCLGSCAVSIILGSHRREGSILYNTLYILQDCRIINYYDKIHRMFFTERTPPWWSQCKEIHNLFLKDKTPFCQGKKKRAPLFFPAIGCLYPYICSDLFFEPIGLKSVQNSDGLICLVNDSWFLASYIPELMFLQAVSKSLFERCAIMYVSYTKSECIFPNGFSKQLLSLRG